MTLAFGARHDSHPRRGHRCPGDCFIAHRGDGGGFRADKSQAFIQTGLGKICALGEEAIPGMDGARAAPFRRIEDFIYAQIRIAGGGRSEEISLIGVPDVQGVTVRFRKNRHRVHPQLPAGADDPHGDLTPVRNQDFVEHTSPHHMFNLQTCKRATVKL